MSPPRNSHPALFPSLGRAASLLLILFLLPPWVARGASPLVTDDADTVPQGHLQLGTGVEYFKAGSLRRWSLQVSPVLGLNDHCEVGMFLGYQWQDAPDSSGAFSGAHGMLDTTLGTKWKWFDQTNHWFSLSTRFDIKLPTASRPEGLGTGTVDPDFILIATKTVGTTSFDLNLGYTFFDAWGTNLSDDEFFVGQTVRHALSDRWSLVAEVFGRIPFGGGRDPTVSFNGGVQFFLQPNLVLEAAALTALGRNSPDLTTYLGFTWVF